MNFGGAKPIVIPRYGSKCQWDDPVLLPLGLADIARNVRYTAQSVASRFGHSTRITLTSGDAITAVGLLRYLASEPGTLNLSAVETVLLMAYDAAGGDIYKVAPFIQSTLAKLTDNAFYANSGLPVVRGINPVISQGFNMGFVAMGDLLLPQGQPLLYLPITDTLYPDSELPFGAPWTPGTRYRVGQVISPSSFQTFGQPGGQGTWVEEQTGFLYQCTQAGISGDATHQPAWPPSYNGTVADNTVQWKESTPIFCSGLPDPPAPIFVSTAADGGSPIAPGARVYVACTFLNPKGEGVNQITNLKGAIDNTKVFVFTNNTAGAVDLVIQTPAIPPYLLPAGPLGAPFGVTGINVYAFIDTNPANSETDLSQIVDPAFYALVNNAPLAAGVNVTISAFPSGQQLPQTSTAATSATIGNVDTGIRFLTTMFQLLSQYITGFSNSAPIAVNVTQSGWPITCLRLPTGTYQTAARIVASTVAGASAAGPYTWISQADVESPGFNQPSVAITATIVTDNTTTVAEFNFTDTYLPGASDVTNYFTRIQIPPIVDVYFARSLLRMVRTGAVGFQSSHLFSDIGDPSAVRLPGGNFNVSENDGDRCICYREVRGVGISFKENGGFAVETNAGDPSTWGARKLWSGTGPAGPKAIDVAGADESGDTSSEFAMWAHRGGVNLYKGTAPSLIGRELLQDWETINWDYGHLVVLKIDHVRRLAYILAPTGNSTVCNARWTLNYFFGMADPVVFVQRRGILVPNVEGRKWSQDDFTGFTFLDAVFIPQKSRNAVQLAGLDVKKEMVFVASDGSIKTVTENQYYDQDFQGNAVGYHSEWRGVLGNAAHNYFSKCIGGQFWFTGNGLLNVFAYDDNLNKYAITGPLSPFVLTPGKRTRRDLPTQDLHVLSQRWGVSFDNGGAAGAWWQAFLSTLYEIPMWDSLPG